jgi:hypothetical protein
MTMRILVAIGFGAGCLLLAADEPKQYVQARKTERVDFPPGGTIRLTHAVGVLNVEAWDRPDVEITTIKPDRVHVTAKRRGNELVITTEFPREFSIPRPYPMGGGTDFNLEYRIKAPGTASLIADLKVGEVNVDNLAGDIHVTLRQGEIMLHLPEDASYDIHTRTDVGAVNSDFPAHQKRRLWLVGVRTAHEDAKAHKLHLRVGYGDVVILKTCIPKPPEPLTAAAEAAGL